MKTRTSSVVFVMLIWVFAPALGCRRTIPPVVTHPAPYTLHVTIRGPRGDLYPTGTIGSLHPELAGAYALVGTETPDHRMAFAVPGGVTGPARLMVSIPGAVPLEESVTLSGIAGELTDHEIQLIAVPIPIRPLPPREAFARDYQGNFGSIKLEGCGLYRDILFDPAVLLVTWAHDKRCFELAMQAHAVRNDNRVVIDPRADYHGLYPVIDLYHEPERFAQYVRDLRAFNNARGEPFEVLLFLSGDGHLASFLDGQGRRDLVAEEHWRRDVAGLAASVASEIAGVTPCWECRHQRDYLRPATYQMMGQFLRQRFPGAWVGVHLISGSSSVSSWRCGDESDPACDAESDDPYRGSEPGFWARCRQEGWCDGLLYQFETGDPYLRPEDYKNYTGFPGALGRYWEVAVRLGNDPWSTATARGNRHGWVQADLIAFEHIYDAYNGHSDEDYGVAWCQRALAIGGWGCGSASYRRP